MIDDVVLLALIAAIAADEDIAQQEAAQFRSLMYSGGGSVVAPEPEPEPDPDGLDTFQTDSFQNDTFQ